MKTSTAYGKKSFSARTANLFGSTFVMTCICFFSATVARSQNCNSCCLPQFPALTVYQTTQTGHGLGFGVEAGNWKKDAGKFSYFIGTSMVWANNTSTESKTGSMPKQLLLSFYVKGQYKITKHLYAVASPGVVNLTYLELQTGFRYVIPLTNVIGISIEPAYAFNQKQFVLNANVHFALR